ncbi:aspartate/glutamate racemase family protein [Sporomusa sphaeroides DSM 2875]|uniref:Hydantoin racemase n=1 Tax=uncultured Sporomusa sp. TaxID=307249 RepID=A0A212LZY3_9FIRM|nr:aspartate/glutamate racemase family protein [Sporomusa sphaeroides]MCM0758164.1 aspartate/glutamate racemase family protein [Sporomusa sphaeroides DSM 2875]SCM83112.1 Hydantoin racemase [uncultured Sporomusa sp.]
MIFWQNRDSRINYIKVRKNHVCYGMGLGIIVLNDAYPGFPGDVRNASAFPYPIQYEIAEGVTNKTLVYDKNPNQCRDSVIAAARKLEQMGCRAIAAECGYFAFFQKAVAAVVDVPVFMSSLLQVPFIQQVIGPQKFVGIICAQKQFLSEEHLKNVGITPGSNYIIAGAQDEYGCTEFDNLWNPLKRPEYPEAYYDKTEQQMVNAARAFVAANPRIGAIMLECTGMQPFARAIQGAVDLPVFSWGTLLDYAFSVVAHRDYYGHV